ncbi:MAG: hypothetical protein VW600_04730 [Ferrovibrio sp.]
MTPLRLIAFRIFNITLGRSAAANRLLRRFLVHVLIDRREQGGRYMASSRFFQMKELD